MRSLKRLGLPQLIALVQSALREAGIETVLSGGTCVSVWTENAYRSLDIDLIPEVIGRRGRIREVMLGLGFSEERRYFVHPDTKLWFEFPSGPVVVGDERPRTIEEVRVSTGTMRLLSPTDCVKDRLAWYLHDNDKQALVQAVAVAQRTSVDITELRRWAKGEHRLAEFEAIVDQLKRARGRTPKRR